MRLGIRIRTVKRTSTVAIGVAGHDKPLVDIYDVATGEVIESVFNVSAEWNADGVLTATVSFYPAEQQGFEPADKSEDHV
jgi:hypothetical protein